MTRKGLEDDEEKVGRRRQIGWKTMRKERESEEKKKAGRRWGKGWKERRTCKMRKTCKKLF
jgi:hypothetical protein